MEPIKKFNRFELKYLLSIEQVGELKKDLEKYIMEIQETYNKSLLPKTIKSIKK